MNKSTVKFRVEQLKVMDAFINTVNDEELIIPWLMCGVPDGASEEDYIFIAQDDELYYNVVKIFKSIVKSEDAYY